MVATQQHMASVQRITSMNPVRYQDVNLAAVQQQFLDVAEDVCLNAEVEADAVFDKKIVIRAEKKTKAEAATAAKLEAEAAKSLPMTWADFEAAHK